MKLLLSKIQDELIAGEFFLKQKMYQLNEDIDKAFSPIEDEKGGYHLHAVCVHDGGAKGGHYFIYIKDHRENVWRKFNDMRVNVVDEVEVFLNANGGHG